MKDIFGKYEKIRDSLDRQYVDTFRNEKSYQKITDLKNDVLQYANTLKDKSHPVIKARCFEYILKNADIYLNSDDIFGVCLEAQNFKNLCDLGCYHYKILKSLSDMWQSELNDKLYPHEEKHFIKYTTGYLFNEFYIDYNHSTPCWSDILLIGIKGIYLRISEYKEKHYPLTEEKQEYFLGMEITYKAILDFFDRLSNALSKRTEPKLKFMKNAIDNLKDNPPSDTYEALLLSWLYWYLQEHIDCVRCRTMGGLDELYLEFYHNDIRNGTFDKEEIKELFLYFMSEFNSFRVGHQQPIYLGGTDIHGKCIVNELSYLILDAYNILSKPNPKLQVKISKNTPDSFTKEVLRTIRSGNSSISLINDEVAVTSLKKLGVPDDEATTYLMSGCWDYAVKDHEVKTVPVRVSLPKILEYTMTNGLCLSTNERVGLMLDDSFDTFEDFYNGFEKQWMYIWQRSKKIIENWENYLSDICPSNMFSATMTDSLDNAVDGYARGMKYNTTIYTCAGLASLVDSLCAIKKFVYDKKLITPDELLLAIKSNWEGFEEIRRIIINDDDKYGNGSMMADELMVRLTKFFADNINGVPNGRGTYWKLGMLSIDRCIAFGKVMGATPDGRLSGMPFSKNLSPVIGMDKKGLTTLMNSVLKIDFTSFPHAGMFDLVLHPSAVAGEEGLNVFMGILKTYFNGGGHSVQFNVFSSDTLKDAQKNPDKYKNLQVRVCGWNVYFTELEKKAQDAFIAQCEHNENSL